MGIPKVLRKKRKRRVVSDDEGIESSLGVLDMSEAIEIEDVSQKRQKFSAFSHVQLPGTIYPRSAYRCDEAPTSHVYHEADVLRDFMVCEGVWRQGHEPDAS